MMGGKRLEGSISAHVPIRAGNQWTDMAAVCSTVKSLSRVRPFATPWPVGYQAPLYMGFSRQEYWSGLPLPSPGDLPDPGIKPVSPALQTDALPSEPAGKPAGIIKFPGESITY